MKRPEQLQAVLFDLDGTLVDTADEFVVVVQALRAEHGMAEMDPVRIRASVSNGARALVNLGLGIDFEAPEFESKRLRLLELYSGVLGTVAKPYPGIPPLLKALDARGIGWGVATNKPRAYAEPLMQALDIQPPMGSLVCPDDVKDRKPHPESLYLNCRELGCAPHQAIYVGDHLRDVEAGRRAGMYTVAAAYGYIEPGDHPQAWGADALVSCSTELTDLILNL
jgi:N-acetyl-D-muramate 6-phosphate phosphatase